MRLRPNLASSPFLDVRPVLAVGASLALVALVLTGISVGEVVRAQSREKSAAKSLVALQMKRAELTARVEQTNLKLAGVGWKSLQAETGEMQGVVARRKLVWSQLLADLERTIPWDVRLVSITPVVERDGAVRVGVNGVAASRDAWLRLVAHLFVDPRFSDPLPTSEQSPSATNGQGYQFSLTVRYWPEGRP
jgi:Tfp pilus assembly protein PilN